MCWRRGWGVMGMSRLQGRRFFIWTRTGRGGCLRGGGHPQGASLRVVGGEHLYGEGGVPMHRTNAAGGGKQRSYDEKEQSLHEGPAEWRFRFS